MFVQKLYAGFGGVGTASCRVVEAAQGYVQVLQGFGGECVDEGIAVLHGESVFAVFFGREAISTTNDVQDAATSLMKDVDVVFVPTDNTVASTMTMIGELSVEYKVPVIGGSTDMVDAGGLLTFGTNYEALGRQTAKMAIKIIEGADPAEVAVEYPETVNLHVNTDMAGKLGIDVSKLSVKE